MGRGARFDDEAVRGPVATVFVSDPTAEAERVAQALRLGGYPVVDVPLSMLVARVGVQSPRVVLVDADTEGALDVVLRMRELPDAEQVHVLFLGRPGAAIATPDAAVAHGGSGLFLRPVDIPSLVKKVDALTGGARIGHASLPPAPRVNVPPPPLSSPKLTMEPSLAASERPGERRSVAPPVGADLQQLLAEAELRVQVRSVADSSVPSPEDEIEAVLPAELLASLDEPLEADEDEVDAVQPARAASARDRTIDGSVPRTTGVSTGGGGSQVSTGSGGSPVSTGEGDAVAAEPGNTHGGTHTGPTGPGGSTTGESVTGEVDTGDVRMSPSMAAAHSVAADRLPSVFGPGEAVTLVARAITLRLTGSLCFVSGAVERRLILREGDAITCASTAEDESLVAFLGARGELPRETVRRFGPKLPAFGRHAGAALVARGYLGQDQMWPTLRAHAEWVLARVMAAAGEGRLTLETQAPGRLGAEPGVFGGATGAEVFVDLVRRTISPADAVERLGGIAARVEAGPAPRLLGECGLEPADLAHVREVTGKTLRDVIDPSSEGDLATVVFALVQLGVLEVVGSAEGQADDADGHAGAAAIDADAVRERVRARSQIVDDGDYFAVLGVARDATGYEVRRAFLELRRAFDPSRMLTPEVADLAGDVRKITVVLEEAYEILKDPARRERYRRAIEGVPATD